MQRFYLNPDYQQLLASEGLDNYKVLSKGEPPGEVIAEEPGRSTRRLRLDNQAFYLKRVEKPRPRKTLESLLKFEVPHHYSWREMQQAQNLQAAGMRVMDVAAAGETTRWGIPAESFIMVHEVSGESLDQVFSTATSDNRPDLLRRLGVFTGSLHRNGFFTPVRMKDVIVDINGEFVLIDREARNPHPKRFQPKHASTALYRTSYRQLRDGLQWTDGDWNNFYTGYREAVADVWEVSESKLQSIRLSKPGEDSSIGSSKWNVKWEQLAPADKQVFFSMGSVLDAPMTRITRDSLSGVSRLALSSAYYVKSFRGRGNRLQHFLGAGRYQRELRNLQYFSELGLPTPSLVAYGAETRGGLLKRALLITEEVTGSTDLEHFIASGKLYAGGVKGARKILAQLARDTRKLHLRGFYHRDLKTRNVLVRYIGEEPELFYFDCPRGKHSPRLTMRRNIVRELAHIERGLRHHVRPVDLMYMYKCYRQHDQLDEEDKAIARDALLYYKQRRMTRERRSRPQRSP